MITIREVTAFMGGPNGFAVFGPFAPGDVVRSLSILNRNTNLVGAACSFSLRLHQDQRTAESDFSSGELLLSTSNAAGNASLPAPGSHRVFLGVTIDRLLYLAFRLVADTDDCVALVSVEVDRSVRVSGDAPRPPKRKQSAGVAKPASEHQALLASVPRLSDESAGRDVPRVKTPPVPDIHPPDNRKFGGQR